MTDLGNGPASPERTLLIVTGSGRSGTSSVAGALKKLGLHIPAPEVEPGPTNPRGFFEPRWAVDFDKRLLAQIGVHNIDGRPQALQMTTEEGAKPAVRKELTEWLSEHLTSDQILVKDPHAFWFSDLWTSVALSLGVTPSFLTMLRHPAEVVGSRDMHYLAKRSDEERKMRETANIAGWVNAALITERASRPHRRAFVRYTDLISDWRTALLAAREHLDLKFEGDLTPGVHHEIDDFIDVSLHRARITWDDLATPDYLRDLAESVWQELSILVEKPHDEAAIKRMDEFRETYDAMYTSSTGLVYHHIVAEVEKARRQGRRQGRRQMAKMQQEHRGAQRARRLATRVSGRVRRLRDRGPAD
jgi:hypothetical protein